MITQGEGYAMEAFRQAEPRYWRDASGAPR